MCFASTLPLEGRPNQAAPPRAPCSRPALLLVRAWVKTWGGLEWIGVDWSGLEWIQVDWGGLKWIGVDWSSLPGP